MALGCLYWIASALGAARVLRGVSTLDTLSPKEPARWPKLSIIIPACNEAHTLEKAMQSKLAEGYPDLEVVLVEDRSTDGTGALVDRLAAADPRITALHVHALPDGWLGKLNAMNEGQKHAQGEWLLFSDADVHFTPGALRRAVAHCEERGLDHLAVFPEIWRSGLLLDCATATLTRQICVGGRFWAVADPRSRAAAGVGAFNLVRRSALARTKGFEWLKLEVGDDMALGQMLKRSGGRSEVMGGRGQVALHLYHSYPELARSAEKSFLAFKFNLALALSVAVLLLLLELSPFLSLLPFAPPAVQLMGLCGLGAALLGAVGVNRFMGHPALPALLFPIGSALVVFLLVRAAVLGAARGGLTWRGTLYPTRALIDGRRIEFP